MRDLRPILEPLMTGGPDAFDPRDTRHDRPVLAVADALVERGADRAAVATLETDLAADAPLAAHLAVKLARSKTVVRAVDRPLHVSVVFAMYKEHTRILRPDQHRHGEDFVVRKIEQLRWLFGDAGPVTWRLWLVDDGCPEGSGRLAQEILAERCPEAPAQVLFLEEAIRSGHPITRPLRSTDESRKGGSVAYGMWTAAQASHEHHIVAFTDADLSTHLGQTGLLVGSIAEGGMDAAIGSRREPTSVVVKHGHRNTRGKLFIYLWKSLISPLHYITDTQCGFKAFSASTVRDVATELIEKRFAFDIELLLKTELRRNGSIDKVPIAWIDSEAASTTTGLQPYLPMLQAAAAMYRKYLPPNDASGTFARLIESLTEAEWQHLAAHVPAAIADADPAGFGRDRLVSADDLRRVAAGVQ